MLVDDEGLVVVVLEVVADEVDVALTVTEEVVELVLDDEIVDCELTEAIGDVLDDVIDEDEGVPLDEDDEEGETLCEALDDVVGDVEAPEVIPRNTRISL